MTVSFAAHHTTSHLGDLDGGFGMLNLDPDLLGMVQMVNGVVEVRVARVVVVQVMLHVVGDHKCIVAHASVPKLSFVPVGMR